MQQIPILELFLRFRACCSRALEASLALVSACSGINTKQLEQMYRDLCSEESGDGFLAFDGEMELDEDLDEGGFENGDNCMGFLQQLQDETNLMKDDPEQKIPAKQEDKMPDLEGVPDSKQLRDIVSASCPTDPFRLENSVSPKKKTDRYALPGTLLEALGMAQRGGCLFNALFRLLVFLRSSTGGADLGWVRNPRNARKASKRLNWHQCLG